MNEVVTMVEINDEDEKCLNLMSENEAAKFLCLHPITLARYRRIGVGPVHYLYPHGRIYYDKKDVVAWLNERIRLDREA
jgi:hypothetical protein